MEYVSLDIYSSGFIEAGETTSLAHKVIDNKWNEDPLYPNLFSPIVKFSAVLETTSAQLMSC